jgi:hypothetical protein
MQGWKTVIFGALLTLGGFFQGVDWVSLIPNDPHTVGWVTSTIGVVVVSLRYLTSTPIGKAAS